MKRKMCLAKSFSLSVYLEISIPSFSHKYTTCWEEKASVYNGDEEILAHLAGSSSVSSAASCCLFYVCQHEPM